MPIRAVKGLSLSGHVAKQYVENDAVFGTVDYFEYNIGATYDFVGLFDVSIHYSDIDITPDTEGKEEAITLRVGRKL